MSMVQLFHRNMSNLQESSRIAEWIVGFTDGEGCFSVSIFRNKTAKLGWQVFPEFVIAQGEKSLAALHIFEDYFGCGKIYVNKRYDNHHEPLYRYCVRTVDDLDGKIIPFFSMHELRTAKSKDFALFARIITLMQKREHLTLEGMITIARLVEKMNHKKASNFLKSSEAIRCAS